MRKYAFSAIISLLVSLGGFANWTFRSSKAYGFTSNEVDKIPSITGTNSFPKRVRASIMSFVRHSFKLKIPNRSSAISQLDIQVPESLRPSSKITISNQYGQSVNAILTIKGHVIEIIFPQAISPGTTLNIDMNIEHILQTPNAWLYSISIKFFGQNEEVQVGTAQFHNY